MSDQTDSYLRDEMAELLKLDVANLSAADSLKLDIATALRLSIDDQVARLQQGERVDTVKLFDASDRLLALFHLA